MRWACGLYYGASALAVSAGVWSTFNGEWMQGIFYVVLSINSMLLVIADRLEEYR